MNVNQLEGYLIPLDSNSATEGFVKNIVVTAWEALKRFGREILALLTMLISKLHRKQKEVHDGYRVETAPDLQDEEERNDAQAARIIQKSMKAANTLKLNAPDDGSPSKILCVNDFIAIPQRFQYLETIYQELTKEFQRVQQGARQHKPDEDWDYEPRKQSASIITSNLHSLQYAISIEQFQSYPRVLIEKAEVEKQLRYYRSEISSLKSAVESMIRIINSIQSFSTEGVQNRIGIVSGWCQALFSEVVKTVPFVETFARSISINSRSVLS